jgi:hypothetical protein
VERELIDEIIKDRQFINESLINYKTKYTLKNAMSTFENLFKTMKVSK